MTIPRLMPTTMDSYQRYLTGSGNTKNVLSTSRSVDSTYMSKALSGQTLAASQQVAAQKELRNRKRPLTATAEEVSAHQ